MLTSIYDHMEQAVKEIKGGSNIKIIFRHSIRHPIRDPTKEKYVKLTNEGKQLALFFGRKIKYNLGFLASSNSDRCKSTLEYILKGHNSSARIIDAKKHLQNPHVEDKLLSRDTFNKYQNTKDIVFALRNGKKLSGIFPLESIAKTILNFIFGNGGIKNTIDLYCTHDFQMAILYSALFDFGARYSDFENNNWPMMLEGMIFWGKRNNFFVSWRGRTKRIINYN